MKARTLSLMSLLLASGSRVIRNLDRSTTDIAGLLVSDVFGFFPHNIPDTVKAANFQHWEHLRLHNPQLQDDNPDLGIDGICALVRVLKAEQDKTIQELHDHLATVPYPVAWISDPTDGAAIDSMLQFVLRLWLFTDPDLEDKSKTLPQAVHDSLASIKGPSNDWLWEDFCAMKLQQSAGFRFTYTHEIAEHLTFAARDELRIFVYTKTLAKYAVPNAAERDWFPPGLLEDFQRTMNLLWPCEDECTQKRVRLLQKKDSIDLEASMGQANKFDLRTYPFFGDRLAKIQERLEAEETRRVNTATVNIAVWGILLTALFGLVSAATGLVSMWTGLRQVGVV